MKVTVVDPPAFTPPYDHSLCAALARRGNDVELVTRIATELLRRFDAPRPVRLLGVKVAGLDEDQVAEDLTQLALPV